MLSVSHKLPTAGLLSGWIFWVTKWGDGVKSHSEWKVLGERILGGWLQKASVTGSCCAPGRVAVLEPESGLGISKTEKRGLFT